MDMSRVGSVVVCSFVALLLGASTAFAQDPPAPAAADPAAAAPPPAAPPPPVAQQSGGAATSLDRPGFDFGARLGYALPMGKTAGSENLSDGVSGAIPLVLEAGYRVNGNFTVGALFQYGLAQIKDGSTTGCGSGIDCSGSVVRLGIEALYNFNLDTALTPWVGLGTGYEWFTISASAGGQSASVTAKGFEFATLHVGGDYRVSPQFALGPFLSASLAQYSSASIDAPGMSGSMDLTDKKMHEWIQFGVRGKFGI